jgi:pimeloyl-ACP methyl ester carboxylesterase
VRLVGWSDGGNISLEIARTYPDSVDRLAVMGANLSPDRSAVHGWAVDWVTDFSQEIDRQIAAGNSDQNWDRPQAAILSFEGIARYVLGRTSQYRSTGIGDGW